MEDSAEFQPSLPTIRSPLRSIWFKPTATIRHIITTDVRQGVVPLAILMGINRSLGQAVDNSVGDSQSLVAILLGILLVGSLYGLLFANLGAVIIGWFANKLGGVGSFEETRAALTWSAVPSVCSLLISVPLIAISGNAVFVSDPLVGESSLAAGIALIFIGLTSVVFGLWTMVLSILTMSEVHQFSAYRAIGAYILASLVFIIPLFIVVLINLS